MRIPPITVRLTLQDLVNSLSGLAQAGGACDIDTDGYCPPCARCNAASREPACSCCDSRQSDAAQEAEDLGPHLYTIGLAQRVRTMLGSHVTLPGVTLLADAIEEALWFAARDLRAGHEVHLHHIGDLVISDEGTGPDLGVMPDRDLVRDWARSGLRG